MKPYVQLFINNQLVRFENPPEIFMTYEHNELHNPTIVKNSYSKTIVVDGTPENNRIFNSFADMKRINGNGLFNPSRKETFVLYRNGEPIETGYVKLNKVKKNGNRVQYEISLFGGLGQFLYALSYKDDGEHLKLSDLKYSVDFNMEVNRYTVKNAWQHITGMKSIDTVYDTINFAPCYNGIPKDFAADKVAIDVESFKYDDVLYNLFETSKDGYTTVDGWLLGELPKEYDEWQTQDLRSYLQRPVIRFKEIINACCNPENNGGYTVDLDNDFFNTDNPYYQDAWMTLPLISELETNSETEVMDVSLSGYKMNFNNVSAGTVFNLDFDFDLLASCDEELADSLVTGLFVQYQGNIEPQAKFNRARYIQLVIYDAKGNAVGGSGIKSFYSNVRYTNDFTYSPEYDSTIETVYGKYNKSTDGKYRFNSETYNLSVKNIVYTDGMYAMIVIKTADCGGTGISGDYLFTDAGNNARYTAADFSVGVTTIDASENKITPFRKITKNKILNSEHTPCDYFLSYLKMFNLHIWKDMYEKKIYVRKRSNFFINEIRDIDNLINRGKDIEITPLTFENKYLNFNHTTVGDRISKEYKDETGIEYGIQKVDTNYNFDNTSKALFENSVFKSAITSRNMSKYYVSLRYKTSVDNYDVPSFYLDGFQTYLFNGEGDTVEGSKITPKTAEEVRQWTSDKYYDLFPKPSFVNDKNEPVDGANVLLFYNGRQLMKDAEGVTINFKITDDIPEFDVLNEGEPCWIWSSNWEIATDTTIGGSPYYGDGYIPVFSRYLTNENNWITHSWDFGTPKYLYVPDYSIDDTSNIYTQYWKPYIRDMYDVNTRIVNAEVLLLERVVGDYLQLFYYFDGTYWLLNKIIDYNITTNDTTRCEFVRVNDINNYLS